MSFSLLFWIIYIVAVLFGGYVGYAPANRWYLGPFGIVMILVGLLGWKVFGPAVHG